MALIADAPGEVLEAEAPRHGDAAHPVPGWMQATGSLDQLAQVIAPADSRRVLVRQLHPGSLEYSTRTLASGANLVGFAHSNVGYATHEEWCGRFVGVTVALEGQGGVRVNGRALDDTTVSYGGDGTEQSMFVPAGQVCIGVHASTSDFESACRLLEVPIPAYDRGLRIDRIPQERLHAFRAYFCRLREMSFDHAFESDAACRESVARQLARLIVGERAPRGAAPVAAGRLRAVRRVHDRVLADPSADYSLAELCRIACVSPRTLEYAFYDHYNMSPIAFVRALRLQEVRRRLRGGGVTVTEAALACGFSHLSQFSADFRRLFGVLPSRLAAQADPAPTIAES